MRIAIIGSGVSGIAAAKTLKRFGHDVVIYERAPRIGGVWAVAYPGVHLQNMGELYTFSNFPWPFDPGLFPSAADILRYLEAAIAHWGLDVRVRHSVSALEPLADGWQVKLDAPDGPHSEKFDYVVVASGHYTQEKAEVQLEGRDCFGGQIISEHEIGDLSVFDGKRVAVVGMGKSAVDVLSFAVGRARELHHVFREARWLLPRKMLGQYTSRLATERLSATFADSWVRPTPFQQRLRDKSPKTGRSNDAFTSHLIRLAQGLRGFRRNKAAKARLKLLDPSYTAGKQFRGTLAPDNYFPSVAKGLIEPHRSALKGFSEDCLLLADGSSIPVDVVVLAIGYKKPALPFLPEPARTEFATEPDGAQLYRHMLHPDLPNLAFAGFNHNTLHITSAEIAATWIAAVLRGDIVLPGREAMEKSIAHIRDWKRANTVFEPTRAYWVGQHFHNYLDVLLMELGVEPNRKKNKLKHWFDHHTPADYAGVADEYERVRGTPRPVLPYDT